MTELKKYPSISRIGHEDNNGILEDGHLVVKEKMDGANFRFTYYPEEGRIVFGSRNIEYWNDGNQPITDHERRWFKINGLLNRLPYISNRKEEPQDDVDDTFEELHIMLSADEDSVITRDHQDELIEFLQDEWEPSGEYKAHLFEEEYDG